LTHCSFLCCCCNNRSLGVVGGWGFQGPEDPLLAGPSLCARVIEGRKRRSALRISARRYERYIPVSSRIPSSAPGTSTPCPFALQERVHHIWTDMHQIYLAAPTLHAITNFAVLHHFPPIFIPSHACAEMWDIRYNIRGARTRAGETYGAR